MRKLTLAFLLAVCGLASAAPPGKCVRLYYDAPPTAKPAHTFGKTIAVMLRNLVGHFPTYSIYFHPVETYRKGDIDTCDASIYIGTYYNNPVPKTFLADFESTKRNVAWVGGNIWQLEDGLNRMFGVKYRSIAGVDAKGEGEPPKFFKFFEYKGETFTKFGAYSPSDPTVFHGAPELTLYDPQETFAQTEVVAWATHSWTHQRAPYIIRRGNRWAVGDNPFTYISEEDRYLIFADVLFDILKEPARYPGKRPALVRLEDVHMKVPDWQLEGMVALFQKVGIPFSVSLIPIFADPMMVIVTEPKDKFLAMTESASYVNFVRNLRNRGGSYLYHGVTHQYGDKPNPTNGVSGTDYEFWDEVHQRPVPDDSPSFVVKRLEKGLTYLDAAGVRPSAWVTPHYAASILDQIIFGQLYRWNIGRGRYAPARATQSKPLPDRFRMDLTGSSDNGRRLRFFDDLKVTLSSNEPAVGQFYPYEIFNDYLGVSYIPENVGYIQLLSDQPVTAIVDQMIGRLKRNRVLRDAWGSFYVHPYLFARDRSHVNAFRENANDIERLLREAVALGYEFIDVKTWVTKH